MFGISDFGIWLAYTLCILSALLCIIYGIKNWNNDLNTENKEIEEELFWEKEEHKIEENL